MPFGNGLTVCYLSTAIWPAYANVQMIKPGFHYTANATTTTQKQSDYKVEQLCFDLKLVVVVVVIGLMETGLYIA